MEEKISIVVPVYNAEKTLDRCVKALQAQTHPNIEIILVNDGSRDSSLEICRRYAAEDARVRVVDKPNGGVSSARNAGLDAAEGDFVMFCDSDDWAEPDWCGCLYRHYIPGNLTVCEILREDVPLQPQPVAEETLEKEKYLHRSMLMCSPINKLFSRQVIEAHHIRFPKELSLGEDFVFCLNYLCVLPGKVRYVYRGLYNYDTSNENTLSSRAPALEQCEAFYQALASAMKILRAEDAESILVRDTFVASHFERNLKITAGRKDLSLREKLAAAAQLEKLEGFRATCRQGIRWGNPVYLNLMRRGFARAGMCWLVLSGALKRKKTQ